MIHVAIVLFTMLVLWEVVRGHRARHTCGYCGGENGEHKQDCPWDFAQRGH